jgi:hypothetical protein
MMIMIDSRDEIENAKLIDVSILVNYNITLIKNINILFLKKL